MGTRPKTTAADAFLHQIAAYLLAIKIARGWSQAKMGEIGGVTHSTIGRALHGKHKLGFPILLALESASGIPIPEELRAAAIAAQQPLGFSDGPTAAELKKVAAEIQQKSPEFQRALLEELKRSLAKSG